MNYPYAVKVNGKWYQPNEEIPETKQEKKPAEPVEAAEKTEDKKKTSKK